MLVVLVLPFLLDVFLLGRVVSILERGIKDIHRTRLITFVVNVLSFERAIIDGVVELSVVFLIVAAFVSTLNLALICVNLLTCIQLELLASNRITVFVFPVAISPLTVAADNLCSALRASPDRVLLVEDHSRALQAICTGQS
jgi:hypothetical protein